MVYTTLCYLEKDDKYLMLFRNKKENDINNGKWIGLGGHIENNETKEECIIREVREETNLILHSICYRGEIHFIADDYYEVTYLFTSNDFSGNISKSNEGILKWIEKDKIFNLPLWEGDYLFLERINSSNEIFKLHLNYKNDKLISYRFE